MNGKTDFIPIRRIWVSPFSPLNFFSRYFSLTFPTIFSVLFSRWNKNNRKKQTICTNVNHQTVHFVWLSGRQARQVRQNRFQHFWLTNEFHKISTFFQMKSFQWTSYAIDDESFGKTNAHPNLMKLSGKNAKLPSKNTPKNSHEWLATDGGSKHWRRATMFER